MGVAKPIPATTAPKGTVFIEDRIRNVRKKRAGGAVFVSPAL